MGHGDDLDVDVGVGAAHRLQIELEELPVTAGLGLLVAERRPGGPDLPRQRGRTVLHEHAHQRSGELWAQGDAGAVLVDEVVHLLGDNVGGLAHPQEHAEVLQQGRLHLAVTSPARGGGKGVHQRPAAVGLGGQEVGHSCEGREHERAR